MARPAIEALVGPCVRHPWLVILASAVLTALALWVSVDRFAINTDTARLISEKVPWRQNEIAVDRAFPQRAGLIVAVIDGDAPERVDQAAAALERALAARRGVIKAVS